MRRPLVLVFCVTFFIGCSTSPAGQDAGTESDAGPHTDAGPEDAGTDAGTADAGADAGAPDAGDAGNPSRYWDGGSCTVKTDCPCFSSDDCAPTHWCQSEDETGANVFCVPGARGPGQVGDPCTGQEDCASALCIEASDGGEHCSALCDTMADCPAELPTCQYIGFGVERSICAP
jgi:hypothetical protein